MSRRRTWGNVLAQRTDERASLGDQHLNEAITKINKVQQQAVALMTNYQPTREKTLSMLFHDTDIEKLRQVRGLIKTNTNIKNYQIGTAEDHDITLSIDYEDAPVPAIEPTALAIYPARVGPLLDFTVAVKAEHRKYEELKGVLRWLNRQATPGAIRYYFPQAMKLVPTSPIWKDLQEVPSRYTMPPDYGIWAQVLRDAANTVAGMMLFPSDTHARERKQMWLTFNPIPVHLDQSDPNKAHYNTDTIIYNL